MPYSEPFTVPHFAADYFHGLCQHVVSVLIQIYQIAVRDRRINSDRYK